VRVRELGQRIAAGIAGACIEQRTLDAVTLDVPPHQLLVLTGNPGSGGDALLNVLNGDRRGVTGQCLVSPAACVQRARVSEAQAAAIIAVWPEGSPSPACSSRRVAERAPAPLLLLDLAEHSAKSCERVDGALLRTHAPVLHWVHSLIQRGGSAVLDAGDALERELASLHNTAVRVIAMRHGRINAAPARQRCRATFHSRSGQSGRRSTVLPTARACPSSASTTHSVGE
jgi:energy-coupling factor transporter ATP-binding protein EcfA2